MTRVHPINRKALSAAITAALFASGTGTVAMAQDQGAESDDEGTVEEVMVTATRRETTVQEVPYNISAISGDFIEDSQIVTNTDLIRSITGASIVDRGHRNAGVINSIMIRGLNVESSAFGDYALSTVPTISTYVNDTPIFANFIVKDLERVEVLRGPQGTLYGSGSLGGTIRYITKAPQLNENSADIDLKYSTTDGSEGHNWSADVVFNFALGDTAAVRVVAGKIDSDGIVDGRNIYQLDSEGLPAAPDGVLSDTAVYDGIRDMDTVDIDYFRISALIEPNDTFSAQLTYQSQEDDIGGRRQVTKGLDGWGNAYSDYQIGSIQPEPSSREVDLASLEMNFDLGFATLTSSTSVYEHEGDSVSENTGFYAQAHWLELYYYNYARPKASALRTYEEEAFIQEIRLVSNGNSDMDWIIGAFYMDQDQVATQNSILHGWARYFDEAWGSCFCPGDDEDFRYNRDENFTETAFFGELTYAVSDNFRITGGLRYFDNEFKNTTNIGVGIWNEGIFRTDDTEFFTGDQSDTLFKLNASWDLDDDKMLYATISEGFRRGGANAVPLSGIWANDPIWQRYDPDSVTNYEIGLKGTANGITYTASAFYVDWEDLQLNDASTNGGFFAAINGGDASTQGLELELHGSSDSINWSFGYAYVDGTLDSDLYKPDDYDQANPVAFSGDRLPGTSEHTLNGALAHSFDLANGRSVVSRLNAYYQSDSENHINRSDSFAQTVDSFSIWDGSVALVDDNWSVALYIRNLFNEEGSTGLFKEEYMGTDPSQKYYGNGSKSFISLPRTVGVSVSFGF